MLSYMHITLVTSQKAPTLGSRGSFTLDTSYSHFPLGILKAITLSKWTLISHLAHIASSNCGVFVGYNSKSIMIMTKLLDSNVFTSNYSLSSLVFHKVPI